MLQILKSVLTGRNEFASGGLLLMIIGGVSVWLRAVPETIWYWIVSQTTMMITVKDDDAAFVWVKEWAALLRPGRIDYKLYLGKASDRQKVELYRRFFPESSEAAAWGFVEASGSAETMAEFQGLLLALDVKSFELREENSDRARESQEILG